MAAGTAFLERKFIRSCGVVAHIEDVVVDSSCRGLRLGQRCLHGGPHAHAGGCRASCSGLTQVMWTAKGSISWLAQDCRSTAGGGRAERLLQSHPGLR